MMTHRSAQPRHSQRASRWRQNRQPSKVYFNLYTQCHGHVRILDVKPSSTPYNAHFSPPSSAIVQYTTSHLSSHSYDLETVVVSC